MSVEVGQDKKKMLTVADLSAHFILALALAGFFYWLTGGWIWPFLAIIGGIFIDMDHFIDYFLYFGLKFDPGDFFARRYLASGKSYIIFHSLEIIMLMWVFSPMILWITPIVTGMTVHLLTDYLFSYRSNPLSLSLLYRWHHKFDLDKTSPDKFS